MDRRKFLELMSTSVAAKGIGLASPVEKEAPASGRPNFLFIICDDLAFRTIGSLNNPEVHTPNIDRLAASGCTFTPLRSVEKHFQERASTQRSLHCAALRSR